MSIIEKLANNASIIRIASAKLDLSVIDPKEASRIKAELAYIADLFQVYIDFENGFDPDGASE
jgi:hypothetical protein